MKHIVPCGALQVGNNEAKISILDAESLGKLGWTCVFSLDFGAKRKENLASKPKYKIVHMMVRIKTCSTNFISNMGKTSSS